MAKYGSEKRREQLQDFLQHDKLLDLMKEASTKATWDWNTSLGDTVKEKYQSLFIKIVEMTNVCIRKGAKGYFWLICSPEVGSIFECATSGYESDNSRLEMGGTEIQYLGTVNRRWDVYIDPLCPQAFVMIGAGCEEVDPTLVGGLMIANFVI